MWGGGRLARRPAAGDTLGRTVPHRNHPPAARNHLKGLTFAARFIILCNDEAPSQAEEGPEGPSRGL